MPLLPPNREHGWTPYAWLVFLGFFFFQPILDPHASRLDWIITAVASAVFLVMYFLLFWVGRPWKYLMVAGMAAMGLGLGHWNVGASVFIIFAVAFMGFVIENAFVALVAIGVIMAALAIDAFLFHAPSPFWATSMIVSFGVGVSNVHFAERSRADAKLRLANEEIEHLAKAAERERIARDLHDVLGHTLSLIIVKSTLAGKLLDRQPLAARKEIADIEKVSREAMAEIRSTLRGYSTYRLGDELERAKTTLRCAGVELKTQTTEVAMSPAQESVLALITREAITNVVRHAQARQCRLELAASNGDCILQIQDDGRGGFENEGNGLRGMRERIEALGGKLERDTSCGTRLRFQFPLVVNGKH
jgi:two-component system, NarL family, sensor histidine kinase DesK